MKKSRKLTCGFPTSIATMIAACLTFVESLTFTLIYYYVFEDARKFRKKDTYKEKNKFIYISIFVSTLVLVSVYIFTMIFSILLLFGQWKKKPSLLRAFLIFTILKCVVVAAAGGLLIYIGVPRREAIATVSVIVVHIYFAMVVAKSRREMVARPLPQQISVAPLHPPPPTLFQPPAPQNVYAPSAPAMGDIPAGYNMATPPGYYSTEHENYPPDYYAEYNHNQYPTNPQFARYN